MPQRQPLIDSTCDSNTAPTASFPAVTAEASPEVAAHAITTAKILSRTSSDTCSSARPGLISGITKPESQISPRTGRHILPKPLTPSTTPVLSNHHQGHSVTPEAKAQSQNSNAGRPSSSSGSSSPTSLSLTNNTKLSRSNSSDTHPTVSSSANSSGRSHVKSGEIEIDGKIDFTKARQGPVEGGGGEEEEGGGSKESCLVTTDGATAAEFSSVSVDKGEPRTGNFAEIRPRRQSLRSVSTHGGGTSPSSPLDTPADDPLEDPLILVTMQKPQTPTTAATVAAAATAGKNDFSTDATTTNTTQNSAASGQPSPFLDIEGPWHPGGHHLNVVTSKASRGWGQPMIKSGSDDGGKSDAFFRRASAAVPTRSFTPSASMPASGESDTSNSMDPKMRPSSLRQEQPRVDESLKRSKSREDVSRAEQLLANSESTPARLEPKGNTRRTSNTSRLSEQKASSPSVAAAPAAAIAGVPSASSSSARGEDGNSSSGGTAAESYHLAPEAPSDPQYLSQQQQQQQQQHFPPSRQLQGFSEHDAFGSNTLKVSPAVSPPNDVGLFVYGQQMPGDFGRHVGHHYFAYPVTPVPTGPTGIGLMQPLVGTEGGNADDPRFGAMRAPSMPSWSSVANRPHMQGGQHSHHSSIQGMEPDPSNPQPVPLPAPPNYSPLVGWNVPITHQFGHPGHSPTWSTGSMMGASRPTTSTGMPLNNAHMHHRHTPTVSAMPPNVGPPFPSGQIDAFYPGSPAMSSHSGAGFSGHSRAPSMQSLFSPQHSRSPSAISQMGNANQMNYHRGVPSGLTFPAVAMPDAAQQRPTPHRSPLLEEFRSRGTRRRLDLADIQGHVVEFSKDQYGSRFTQEKLDLASEEERQLVFDEILLSAREVMNDVFGNYVVQKLFEFGTPQQCTLLIDQMRGHVVKLSLCTYGCRVVQRALECVPLAEKLLLSLELEPQVLACVKDQNANHVVQKLLERLPPEAVDFVPRAFQGNVQTLASHCYSCRVLQRVFEHCREDQSRPLLEELMARPSIAMEDQYGNYVMQWIILHGTDVDRKRIIQVTKGNMLRLSLHKFASNVVEEVVRHSPDADREELIEETMKPVFAPRAAQASALVGHFGPNETLEIPVLLMMKDQYGNYVVQRLLEHAQGTQRERLITHIRPFLQHMKRFSTGFTKHLNAIERLLDMPGQNTVRVSTGTSTEDLSTRASTALSISENVNDMHAPTLTSAPTKS